MYELDRALPESTQPIEVYLKQVLQTLHGLTRAVRVHDQCCPVRTMTCSSAGVVVQVRSLCRKQFFARALGNKVAARQHEQRGSAGSQHSHRASAVQMPQGDSWTNPGVLGPGYMGGFSNPLSQHR